MEPDVNLKKVQAILKGTTKEQSEEWKAIIRSVSSSAVVIVAVSQSALGPRIEQAGTGTLVFVEGSHFILTAAHVWECVLKRADKLGITIRTGRSFPNEFLMEVATIAPFALPRQRDWDEWGPDLILLRIPPFHVGTIEAFKTFYNLSTETRRLTNSNHLETWMLFGAPHALGQFTQTQAHLHARAFQVIEESSYSRDGLDYIDVFAHWPSQQVPINFGGVSGGGLWKILIFSEPSTGKLDYIRTLEGVAFYHLRIEGDHGVIRCHGLESIRLLTAKGLAA